MKPARTLTVALLALAAFVATGRVAAPFPAPGADRPADVEKEVKALEQKLREASLKGDVSFFEHAWADGYVRTNFAGRLMGRDKALEDYRSGRLKYESLDFEDVAVHVYGDTAVVTARARVDGQYDDQELSGEFRHTRVWVKGPSGWRIVALHTSRIL